MAERDNLWGLSSLCGCKQSFLDDCKETKRTSALISVYKVTLLSSLISTLPLSFQSKVSASSRLCENWNIIRLEFMFDDDHYKAAELIFLFVCLLCTWTHTTSPDSSATIFHSGTQDSKINQSKFIMTHFKALRRIHSSPSKLKVRRKEIENPRVARSIGVNWKWISECMLFATCKQWWDFILILRLILLHSSPFLWRSHVENSKSKKTKTLRFEKS